MSERLLERLGSGLRPPEAVGPGGLGSGGLGPGGLGSGAIDRRRVDGCLRALGVVCATLLASLLLLLLLALATPDGLRAVRLAETAPQELSPSQPSDRAVSPWSRPAA